MCIRNLARNGHQRALNQLNKCFFAYFISGIALNCPLDWGNIWFARIPQLSKDFWYLLYNLGRRRERGAQYRFGGGVGRWMGIWSFVLPSPPLRDGMGWDGRNWGRVFFFFFLQPPVRGEWTENQFRGQSATELTQKLARSTVHSISSIFIQVESWVQRCK